MVLRIGIVEDDEAFCESLNQAFTNEGYTVDAWRDGRLAQVSLTARLPDLLVLNWTMTSTFGIDLLKGMRSAPRSAAIPVIMLATDATENDKLLALSLGADDYLVKPFSMLEIVLRVRNLLRRMKINESQLVLKVSDIVLDRNSYTVLRSNKEIKLGPTEYKILEFLMRNPGTVHTRTDVLTNVWGPHATVDPRVVDVHIGRLRKCISNSENDDIIRTIRGAGYALG
ncbi:winged helix-turn-helix domain-containing protein [Rhizobium rhizogenes]|uniref:Phosphate regulon transcriptional regulatory protein PhoB n=1 Tax=Rhizobium rhizogenes (strain K84 / ATCC BAA-868) TaxID=311403 RepID=B9JNY4_RHIR8|nr:phosphate regulon transcriptional regulatory protein PhoB [Rhizobium rhizogenes K84]